MPVLPLTVVADYGNLCGENPLWDDRTGSLYWADCYGQKVYRCDWARRHHRLLKAGLPVTGFAFNEPAGFVVANGEGIWLWDGFDRVEKIASEVDGVRLQMNDCLADPKGRLLAGTCYYKAGSEYPPGHLVSVDCDGQVAILDEGIHLANGLGLSPDHQTLYFSDSAARRIYAYEYDVQTGRARNRRSLVSVPQEEGVPDGMTVDAEGFLWSAQWYGSCVVRYDPEGRIERRIETPAKQTSSIVFGGPDLTDIFITSASHPEIDSIMPPGYDPHSGTVGGALYHMNLGIRGRIEHRASIRCKTHDQE